ncbi:MAG: PIG-L family deacetylase [Bacillus sp. (in: firmicutes)]
MLIALNFVLIFLLADFLNAVNNSHLTKRLKRSVFVISLFLFFDILLSVVSYVWKPMQIMLLLIEVSILLAILYIKKCGEKICQYKDVEIGKEEFFGNQTVMLLVPHEDDEVNLLGGVIEEYIKHGSKVLIVFSTNGDGRERENPKQSGAIRIREAIDVLSHLGVQEENVFFLGYGDGWDLDKGHIYNCNDTEVVRSYAGRTETYGVETHSAYREGKAYTRNHYLSDIKDIILEHKPDVLYCIDYDSHSDHRALSVMFEKVMGEILCSTNYRPEVYKGYAYRTAWNAPRDYNDSLNILSTVEQKSKEDIDFYNWKERVRLPIDVKSISRDLGKSRLYRALELYRSQQAQLSAVSIINGDKVFWKRRTDSLCYDAKITVSSGDAAKLTDFMMLDCSNLYENGDCPWDGVWHPEPNDFERKIKVEFQNPKYIQRILLYDNPSANDNILDVEIELDDGTLLHSGRLNNFGQATSIVVDKIIRFFEIQVKQFEGEHFGLTEIEVYSDPAPLKALYKLVDDRGNFMYDYILPQDGKQAFSVYSNFTDKNKVKEYQVSCSKNCRVDRLADRFCVYCPPGQQGVVTVQDIDGKELDRMIIRNPLFITRKLLAIYLSVDGYKAIHKMFVFKILKLIKKF